MLVSILACAACEMKVLLLMFLSDGSVHLELSELYHFIPLEVYPVVEVSGPKHIVV